METRNVNSNEELRAFDTARIFHGNQVDRVGAPYIYHLLRTADNLKSMFPDYTQAELQAAWLHDVLEDTEATPDELLRLGILPRAVEIIQALTKPPGAEYLFWIASLVAAGDASVLRVKLADNADNRDPARCGTGGQTRQFIRRLNAKYIPARRILERALGVGEAA